MGSSSATKPSRPKQGVWARDSVSRGRRVQQTAVGRGHLSRLVGRGEGSPRTCDAQRRGLSISFQRSPSPEETLQAPWEGHPQSWSVGEHGGVRGQC